MGTSRLNMRRLLKPPNIEMVVENAQLSRGDRWWKMREAVTEQEEQCDCFSCSERRMRKKVKMTRLLVGWQEPV